MDSTTPGYRLPNTLNNADLKPESTTSFEVGLEAAFLNDRIGFDLTYYKTTTTILEEQVEVVVTIILANVSQATARREPSMHIQSASCR